MQTESADPHSGNRLLPLEEITHRKLQMALEVWRDKRGARAFPARGDLAPRDMAAFLAHVTLWRALGGDWQYRIMGDVDVAIYGRSMAGLCVSVLDRFKEGNGKRVKAVLDRVADTRAPLVSKGWFVTSDGRHIPHEMLFLPLGPDAQTVDHILGVSVHVQSHCRSD